MNKYRRNIYVSITTFYRATQQNSFDNLNRTETDIAEELRELQRLVGVYSGDCGSELARDYVELERAVEQGGYVETSTAHHLNYGGYTASSSLTDEYGEYATRMNYLDKQP